MIEDPHLRYVAELLGEPFLAYVTDARLEEVRDRVEGNCESLEGDSERSLLRVLETARQWVPLPAPAPPPLAPDGGFPDGSPRDRMRRFGWVDMDAEQSWANLARLSTGAALSELPLSLDPAERAVAEAARDFFAVTLIPLARPDAPFGHHPSISQGRREAFAEAVATDGSISRLVDAETGYWTSASGVGYGAPPTPSRLLDLVLATAEQHVRLFQQVEADMFIDANIRYLNLVRELCERGSADVPALVGFTGVALPTGLTLVGPRGGQLRRGRASDLRLAETGQLGMVLETTCGLRLATSDELPPDEFFGTGELYLDADFVSISGILATRDQEERAFPRYAWAKLLDPLSPFTGWLQPERRRRGAVELSEDAARELALWLGRLEANYHPSVRVSLKRTISAFAERETPEDALVDLVIALESLFGGPTELSLRISTALAWLLSADAEERAVIQHDAKRVYNARSKLVHGDELEPEQTLEHQRKAEWLVLESLQRLLTSRADLIANRERSNALILGQ